MEPLTCKEIAEIIDGHLIGSSNELIHSLNRIEFAGKGELTFLSDSQFEKYLAESEATCIITYDSLTIEPSLNQCFILVKEPFNKLVVLLKYLESKNKRAGSFIHPTAIIDNTTVISESAYIGPYCVIGKNCKIEDNVILKSNVTMYDDVIIGSDTVLNANIVCYNDTIIGSNCIIHSGAVIGSDGFRYIEHPDGSYEKVPQIGNVIIQDDVEIGANTTIDCALIGSTVIEKGVKLDNLIQIAHNCIIGENSAFSGQVGLAGSCTVGKRNRFGGQVGLAGHIETADDVLIIAQSGVSKSIPKKGIYFGSPVKERRTAFRIEAALRMLPDFIDEFKEMKKKIDKLAE